MIPTDFGSWLHMSWKGRGLRCHRNFREKRLLCLILSKQFIDELETGRQNDKTVCSALGAPCVCTKRQLFSRFR